MRAVHRSGQEITTSSPPWWRAVLIGSLLLPVSVWFGTYAYVVVQTLQWGQTTLQLGGVSVLFFVTVLALALRLISKRLGLERSELLLIYIMMTISVSATGIGGPPFMVNYMAAGQYYATPENQWEQIIPLVPEHFTINSWPQVLGFYEATTTLYSWKTISVWLLPLGYWCSILLLMMVGAMFLANLIGRQWVEHERLTFPLVQIPLEMTQVSDLSRFWGNRMMWIGFAIPAVLESINYINFLHPSFPKIQIKPRKLASGFTKPPWMYIKSLDLTFFPWVIGVAFLLSTEMSFSCWFFWLLQRVEWVVGGMMGFVEASSREAGLARLPMTGIQGAGGLYALVLLSLWTARRQIKDEMTKLWSPQEDGVSMFSPLASMIGWVAVMAALVMLTNLGGMPVSISVPLFLFFFLSSLSIGRVVSEAGATRTYAPAMGPLGLITAATGTDALSTNTKIALAYNSWWYRDYRDNYMPHLLATLKMRHEGGISVRQLRWALPLTMVITVVSSVWSMLHIYYKYGGASAVVRFWYTAVGKTPLNMLASWRDTPVPHDWLGLGGMIAGGLFTVGLTLARQHIYGWPFHPVGFVLAFSNGMWRMWMPFFIAWLIKTVILRYFGIKTYQQARPLFLGVIMGDFITAICWGTYGMIVGQKMYFFFR